MKCSNTDNKHFRKKLKAYIEELKEAILQEREAEMDFHLNEIKTISGKERERRGRAILNLKCSFKGEMLGERYLIRVHRSKEFLENEISVGDYGLVSNGSTNSSRRCSTKKAFKKKSEGRFIC